ncbi:CHAT domain-containing protein [Acrocarpospora corrugata]|uniref:CHAT domain-containing protein n=2 Tax=Acrocarpospora corrugata TaxID=35763 RepID=UPI0031D8196F
MRERLLDAIRKRIDALDATGDSAHVLAARAVADAAELMNLVADPAEDLEVAYVIGWFHWVRYEVLPKGDGQKDLLAAMVLLTPVYEAFPERVPEPLHEFYRQHLGARSGPRRPEQQNDEAVDLLGSYEETGELSALHQAVELLRNAMDATSPSHYGRIQILSNLGGALARLSERQQHRDPSMLEEAVRLGREAVTATPPNHPAPPQHLNELGLTLLVVFRKTQELSTVREAVEMFRQALDGAPVDHPARGRMLANLGIALQAEGTPAGAVSLLDEAAQSLHQALDLTPPDSLVRGAMLFSLGSVLYDHFRLNGDGTLLDEAARVSRAAVAATPAVGPARANHLNSLSTVLRTQFEWTDELALLYESAQTGREAVSAITPDHPSHALFSGNLGGVLQHLARRIGDTGLLRESVRLGRDAVATASTDHPGRAVMLSNLAGALCETFRQNGELPVLYEAVQVARDATEAVSLGGPGRAFYSSNLGSALAMLFEQVGQLPVLRDAVQAGRDAVEATPSGHSDRARYSSNLAATLAREFEWTGRLPTLREAVQAARDAVVAIPPGHWARGMHLASLASILQTLSEQTGEFSVLQEAVQAGRDAVAATSPDHADRPTTLSTLAGIQFNVYRRTLDLATLEQAIEAARNALNATSRDHSAHALYSSNLGIVLQTLSDRADELPVLCMAVEAFREAAATTPRDHPGRAMYCSNLAGAQKAMFQRTGELSALHQAEQAIRDAVDITPIDHPNRAGYSYNLAGILQALFDHDGDPATLAQAKVHFAEGATATMAPIWIRIASYRGLGWAAMSVGDSVSALAAYENAITLVPQIAPRRLSHPDREHGLGAIAGLAAEAASAAVAAGQPEHAVELLEQTRGVLLAEAMDTRGEFRELQTQESALAEELADLRDAMDAVDRMGTDDTGRITRELRVPYLEQLRQPNSLELIRQLESQREQLAQQWDALLGRIRSLPNQSGFLLPPPIAALQSAAIDGPVVMVNVSRYRGDALILGNNSDRPVRVVALPGLTRAVVLEQANRFLTAHGAEDDSISEGEMLAVLSWLWDECAEPILNSLGFPGSPKPGQPWPRLWWCPVGEMAFFPLHAAGHHVGIGDSYEATRTEEPRTVIDRVVSSYIPTIRALQYARQARSSPPAVPESGETPTGALIVAMPDTPGASRLSGVSDEAQRLTELVVATQILAGPQATYDAVWLALPRHRIAHLACHGCSDWNMPADSLLLLHDYRTRPFTVTTISRLQLPHAELAYLSACSTTASNQRLADRNWLGALPACPI